MRAVDMKEGHSKQSVYLAGHRFTVSVIFSRLLAVCCTGKACFGVSSRLHWAIGLG